MPAVLRQGVYGDPAAWADVNRGAQELSGCASRPLREKLMEVGARVVHHSSYVTLQMAEVAVPRALYAVIPDFVQRLAAPPRSLQRG